MKKLKEYEWGIVGSGIAGIAIAEILSREGHSVVLIEKNQTIASETTREFHEWLHTGALYTLVPDRLKTLRFILGAIDDLVEFYSCFKNMNLKPSTNGLKITDSEKGWYSNNFIHFKYRIKGRKITFPWIIGIARSIFLIEKIHNHDWIRRRAGEMVHFKKGKLKRIISIMKELFLSKKKFKTIKTPDFTINSRNLINDLLNAAISNGLEISLDNKINSIQSINNHNILKGNKEDFKVNNVVVASGEGIKNFSNVKIKTSYAPIAVVSGLDQKSKSFVELDYYPKNCINLLTKENGYGLAGGISLSNKKDCHKYLDYVMEKHRELQPAIKEENRYLGVKTEITFKKEPRGYLYHIVNSDSNIWSIVPGKFTLAFSLAPEFYRRVYNKNPKKFFKAKSVEKHNEMLSQTVWKDVYNKKEGINGIN